jgi:Trypsin
VVAINKNAKASDSIELAQPIDSVGRVKVTTYSSKTSTGWNTGTGTLVAPNKVLTAAHVIDPNLDGIIEVKDLSKYSFELGDDLDEGADHSLKIEQVSLHPAWKASEANRISDADTSGDSPNARYDLAVLTLSDDFTEVDPLKVAPDVPKLADNEAFLGKKGTLVGYGDFGSPTAYSTNNDGLRRAAENIIDSADNGIIRIDYDSTYSFDQKNNDQGLSSPNLDGSSPELFPVEDSSPKPIRLEGGIAPGDSGGPLLVESNGDSVVVGVASEELSLDGLLGYGSIYIYGALNDSQTIDFLSAQEVI